jgi:hypothetical protein
VFVRTWRILNPPLSFSASFKKRFELANCDGAWTDLAHMVLAGHPEDPSPCTDIGTTPKGVTMRLMFKMHWSLRRAMTEDLQRPHEFAYERVGFVGCRAAAITGGILILAASYKGVADENYLRDKTVGARINGSALREALQTSLTERAAMFHVHLHEHNGQPAPSFTDTKESRKFIPDFFNVTPALPHGTLILSEDSATGHCWVSKTAKPAAFDQIIFSGAPLQLINVQT